MKRFVALLFALTMLCAAALAEGEFPELNEQGFLDEGEFVYENADDGIWRYVSETLKVEIKKYVQSSPKRIWYEAEVWTNGDEAFHMIPANPDDRMGGDMQVFLSNEKTAEEYLAMGAYDVLAFGPYLIRDGELNEFGLETYGLSHAQRTAIGMVEPGHYFAMMLEGRHSKSSGDGISFLAEKLYERGCTQAFNLDGGATSCIVFMGKQLNISNAEYPRASARGTAEILGIGTSELVRMPEEE